MAGDGIRSRNPTCPRTRPYVLTSGRTRCTHRLALETLVTVAPEEGLNRLPTRPAYWRVHEICGTPVSVAEISACLGIPLGVARVVISDLADLRLVRLQGGETTPEGRPPLALMERVLDGLQRL